MHWMNAKELVPALIMFIVSVSQAFAQGKGTDKCGGKGGGGPQGAPEIDGLAGIAAIALLVLPPLPKEVGLTAGRHRDGSHFRVEH